MTNPFKDSSPGFDLAFNCRLIDSLKLNSDMFGAAGSMRSFESALSGLDALRPNLDFGEAFANKDILNGLVKLDLGASVVHSPLASTQLNDIQSSIAGIVPMLTAQFRDSGVMESIASGATQQYAIANIPPINIGIADALSTHTLMPDFTSQIHESMTGILQAADSVKAFQSELGQVSSRIVANSGVGTFNIADTASLFGNTTFADAMSVLVPQMPTFPDFAGLKLLADLDIDRDYLQFVEDELLADEVTAKAYKTAITALVRRLKVPRKKARTIVVSVVWLSWFSTLMTVMLAGPEQVQTIASVVLSATGALNADSIAKAAGNLVGKATAPNQVTP